MIRKKRWCPLPRRAPAARDRAAVRVKDRFLPETLKVWACRPDAGVLADPNGVSAVLIRKKSV